LQIYLPELSDGCSPAPSHLLSEYQNKLLIVQRGNCTFLEKAQYAHQAGVSVLAIINTEDKIEAVASGLGIDSTITASMVSPLENFPIV
jgi:hypothetical protein